MNMKLALPCACLLVVAWASAGCSVSGEHALRAAGVTAADMQIFCHPESKASFSLGERRLAVLTYSVDSSQDVAGSSSRVPHFVVAGAPALWGVGPVTGWEGPRVILWSKQDTWWALTDLGGARGATLLVAYDNCAADGPIELHVYQEPQVDAASMKWWFFTWIPGKLARDGFVLRPVPQSGPVRVSIEAMRDGKLETIGSIRVDRASEAIKLHIEKEATENASSKPAEEP